MRTKKQKQPSSSFEHVFLGERVNILSDLKSTQSSHTEDGGESVEAYFQVQGYVLDIDVNYIYYGETPDQVTGAIKKKVVALITLISESSMIDDLMEGTESPSKELN